MWGNIVQDQLGVSQNKCQVLTNQLSNSTNLLYTAAAAQEESAVNDQFIKEVTLLNGSEDWDRHIKLKFLLASRSFALATCKQAWRKFEEFKEDEDTTVHVWLHDLLTEVFHGDNLYICWANGESASSRQPMKAYERSRSTGKKPDFGVFQYRSETVFGEFKRFGVASDSNAGVVDFLKVAVFLVGSTNYKKQVEKLSNTQTVALQRTKDTLDIYDMRLRYDGLYAMRHLASCRVSRRAADLGTLVNLFSALYAVKSQVETSEFVGNPFEEDLVSDARSAVHDADYTPPLHPTPVKATQPCISNHPFHVVFSNAV